MRVLHVTSEYPPLVHGGLGRHVDGLTRAQVAGGAVVLVLAPSDDVTAPSRSGAAEQEQRHGVTVRRVPRRLPTGTRAGGDDDLVGAVAAMQRRMADAASSMAVVDVVHAHDWMSAEAGRAIATTRGVPLVLTLHATEHGRRFGRLDEPLHRAVHAAERAAVAAADRVVVCSTAMRAEAIAHGARPDVVHVVPSGVELARWEVEARDAKAARQRWRAGCDHLVVAAGRLEWEKGFSTLLRALPALTARRPSTRVVVAGTGSYAPVLQQLVADLDVVEQLAWPGRLATHELAALFATADAVVVPSRYEPFGLVALEAQAAGAPVVVTRTGGLSDLVEDGVTGRVIEPGDVDQLTGVLEELLADPDLGRRLGHAARDRARTQEWHHVAAPLLALYDGGPPTVR